ncbi:MAG: pilin [Pseudomonadota bacterium]
MQTRGFTLIELMVVTAIVAILSAIATLAYQRYVTRAYVVEALSITSAVKDRVEDFYSYFGEFPETNAAVDLPAARDITGPSVSAVGIADGAVHVEFASDFNTELNGRVLSIRPTTRIDDGAARTISWVCGFKAPLDGMEVAGNNLTNVDNANLPSACQGTTL